MDAYSVPRGSALQVVQGHQFFSNYLGNLINPVVAPTSVLEKKKKILQSLQYLLSITAVPLELYGAHDDSRATGCMRKSAGWHSRTRLHSSSSVCPFYTPRRNLLGKLVDPCTGMPAGRVQLILARSAGVPSNSSSPSTAQGFSTPRLNASHPPGSTVISHGLLG